MLRLVKCLFPFIFAIVCVSRCCATGKTWVLLAAGSRTYENYRHQSNIYHAYQIVKSRGIPDENIIVMHYDDIAFNKKNPMKGEVFNKPDGPNVYQNIPKDYVGKQVSAYHFLSVLSGDFAVMKHVGSEKVVNSTDKDNIFVFYADHGGNGVIQFINEEMYAIELSMTLATMTKAKQYANIVFFVESCYAGSLFFDDLLKNNTGIYAMTSANPFEPSHARYYDKKIGAILGSEFSTKFLEILDDQGFDSSISELYNKVKAAVKGSHVSQYGDLSVAEKSISEFIGGGDQLKRSKSLNRHHYIHPEIRRNDDDDLVSSLDVPIALLQNKIETATHLEEKEQLQREIARLLKNRDVVDRILDNILIDACENDEEKYSALKKMNGTITLKNAHCAKAVTKAFSEKCFRIPDNPYVVGVIKDLVKLCNVDWWSDQERAVEVIQNVCEEYEDKPLRVL